MKGNCMPLDSKWLVWFPPKKKTTSVKIIHHHGVWLVTGCHHRQTGPQNLWKEKKNIKKTTEVFCWTIELWPCFKCFWKTGIFL